MRPLMAARPDAYRKLIDTSLWQPATDRNDVFDTNLIPEASVGPLTGCHVVWIITQADTSVPAHEQDPVLPPGQLFGATPAFAVSHDLGFRLVERWQFNLVQVIKPNGSADAATRRVGSRSAWPPGTDPGWDRRRPPRRPPG